MWWHYLNRLLKFTFYNLLFLLVLCPEWPAFGDEKYRLYTVVGLRQFDFLVWELEAIGVKGETLLTAGHIYLDESTRQQVVLDYLAVVGEVNRLTAEINTIYADPQTADPDTATQDLQTQLHQKRIELERLQPLAEAILQEQVATILNEQGIQIAGQTWPPVMMHMTPLPLMLMVSPRDHIERKYQIPLLHGLTTPEQEVMETAVWDTLNLSALVVPIGGLATYPAMIQETSNINWLAEVTAHEWTHHYLDPRPLGLNYSDPPVRIINETVASIVGKEIGALVIERFYPEYIPPPPAAPPPTSATPTSPPPFDFQAEMAETRRTVDRLLAEGKIETAEFYMEARRRFFVTNGYNIRKLNQAYFAFYGAYADEPGATGEDPIGPLVRQIREQTASLAEFLQVMAPVGSFVELEETAVQLRPP